MPEISVTTVIPAPPARVWDDLSVIRSHVQWMDDAESITFASEQREGVGTAFVTATRVGPFRLTDRMVVTEWEPGLVMGVRHTGMVTGTGRFTLEPVPGPPAATRFTWEEKLRFPAWMGGALGGRVGAPLLERIWRRNLDNLRRRFDAP